TCFCSSLCAFHAHSTLHPFPTRRSSDLADHHIRHIFENLIPLNVAHVIESRACLQHMGCESNLLTPLNVFLAHIDQGNPGILLLLHHFHHQGTQDRKLE